MIQRTVKIPLVFAANLDDSNIDIFPTDVPVVKSPDGNYYECESDEAGYIGGEAGYIDGTKFPLLLRYVGNKPCQVEIVITLTERPAGWYWVKYSLNPYIPCYYFGNGDWIMSDGRTVSDEHWSDILPELLIPSKQEDANG